MGPDGFRTIALEPGARRTPYWTTVMRTLQRSEQ